MAADGRIERFGRRMYTPAVAGATPAPRSARAEALPPGTGFVAPEASARSLPSRVRRNSCAPPPSLRSRGFDLRPRFGGKIPAAPPPPPLVAVGGFVMRACGFRFFFSFCASVGISFRLVAAHLSSGLAGEGNGPRFRINFFL